MKKIYLKPSTEMVLTQSTTMICGSQGVTSNKGIDYGGVDDTGEKEPAARRQRDVWEDETEEED